MTEWLIDLPGCWPHRINANDRPHWTDTMRKTALIRQTAHYAARAAKVPQLDRCTMTLVVYPPDRRRRDLGNLMPVLKAAIDGCRDAKVIRDDTADIVTAVGEEHREVRKGGGLALLIKEMS